MPSRRNLQLKVLLRSPPIAVFEFFTTHEGRERFLCETSTDNLGEALLTFPNGERTTIVDVQRVTGRRFRFTYFSDPVQVEFDAAGEGTIVTLTTTVAAAEAEEIRAGWVSVLLALKTAADFGKYLRNHDRSRCWDQDFVDN